MSVLHSKIEEIDKRGKALFKAKKYLDAAEVFTEALDLIQTKVDDVENYGNLGRQMVTLMNNRSAMYEKGGVPDLALVGTYWYRDFYLCLPVSLSCIEYDICCGDFIFLGHIL